MKKKVLIIVLLVCAQLGAFYLKSHSQIDHPDKLGQKIPNGKAVINVVYSERDKCPSLPPIKELIADETTLDETKTGAKVECDNDDIANRIMFAFKEDIQRFTWVKKKDRHGNYKHYVIYVDKETGNKIREWATKNL